MSTQEVTNDGSYLSGVRQIGVVDLFLNGALEKGDELSLEIPEEVKEKGGCSATVASDGQMLVAGNRKFNSPTKAAHEATGGAQADGWTSWVRKKDGKTLDDIRQALLDQLANKTSRSDASDGHLNLSLERHKRLKQARVRADEHVPESFPLPELIGLWGAKRRSQELIQLVEVDLANHGLTARPSLMEARPADSVKLVHKVEGHERLSPTVGALPSAGAGIEGVREKADLQEAFTIMLLKDYSQVPVFSKNDVLRGVVTWKSLARAMNSDPKCLLVHATEPCDPVESHRELLEVIREIQDKGFVFVNGNDGRVSGIVTTTDVAQRYSEAAIPFLLIGVIDTLLRRIVAENIPMSLINKLCSQEGLGERQLDSANSMTMGDYKRVLENPEGWKRLGWPVNRKAFSDQLGVIVKIRNDVMHFNPDPLPEDCVVQLKSMISLLRHHNTA